VKGNAYGHGLEEFVPMAESCGIHHFSVHSADEARKVLEVKHGEDTEIMIMGYIDNEDLEWAISKNISFRFLFLHEPGLFSLI
jgi:alanine racemase